MDKYPHATFDYDAEALALWLRDHPDEDGGSVLGNVRWYVLNGDIAGARSYPFVTSVDLGPSSR